MTRLDGQCHTEKRFDKAVKLSAMKDRESWLEGLLASRDWPAIRQIRKGFDPKVGRLRNSRDELVESAQRPTTLAKYNSSVQWRVPHVSAAPVGPSMGPLLPINCGEFTREEVRLVLLRLRQGKSTGVDQIPSEYLRALAADDSALDIKLSLLNHCWAEKTIPKGWKQAKVV